MKRITIVTLTALMLGATQADYMIKIPLEQAQGGSLPNSSINIGSGSHQEIPEMELPTVSTHMILNFLNGEVISGTHPYINSISNSIGDGIVIYTINASTNINLAFSEVNDRMGGRMYAIIFNSMPCIKVSTKSYNCSFTLSDSVLGIGIDGAGTSVNDVLGDGYDPLYIELDISN